LALSEVVMEVIRWRTKFHNVRYKRQTLGVASNAFASLLGCIHLIRSHTRFATLLGRYHVLDLADLPKVTILRAVVELASSTRILPIAQH
jgi:hypothetical protein